MNHPAGNAGILPASLSSRRQAHRRQDAGAPSSLLISPDARAYICLHRPELAPAFESAGDQASIPIESLLRTGPAQYVPSSEFRVPGPINSEPGTRNPEPTRGLGDAIAALLRILGIHGVITLLKRRGVARGCQCAARQARLNLLTPRLLGLLEPWHLTLAMLLAWLFFVIALLLR